MRMIENGRAWRNDSAGDAAAIDPGDAAGLFAALHRKAPVTHRDMLDEAAAAVLAGPRRTPSAEDQTAYLSGVNRRGELTDRSYWGQNDTTAHKWGETELGTGATITYSFSLIPRLTATERATILKSFALWSAVANITFVEANLGLTADVMVRRGRDGGAYNSTPHSEGSGSTPGQSRGQAIISIDTSVLGFDLSGSFDVVGGYGLSTAIHEIGHLLGLGHGGGYNGAVDPATEQFSAYDDQMYTIMSYINWLNDDAKFLALNPYQGTDWGRTVDGYYRQAPHTMMQLDIIAIQQLYGAATTTPLDGGETYGFNSTIAGPVGEFFDFTINTSPVITLYSQGTGNVFDLSGYDDAQVIDLTPGAFSSVGGLTNNVGIAIGTVIETAIGGSGADMIRASDVSSTLIGGGGEDVLIGGAGIDTLTGGTDADTFVVEGFRDSARNPRRADTITDFASADGDRIDLSMIDAIAGAADDPFAFLGRAAFTGTEGELRFARARGDLVIMGDVNGDGRADFAIRLEDVGAILAADLVL